MRKNFILIISLVLLDFLSKTYFKDKHIQLTKYFSFNYVENTGAIFGLFKNNNTFFIILTVLLICLLFYYLKKEKHLRLGFSLVLAGAIGNLIDRLIYGFVIDFIDLKIWPVFNIADSCITIGVLILIYKSIKTKNLNTIEQHKEHGG